MLSSDVPEEEVVPLKFATLAQELYDSKFGSLLGADPVAYCKQH